MNLKNSVLLLVLPLFFACSQTATNNEKVKLIELKESTDILPISSFASKIDYLELKVAEANLTMGEIENINVIGENLIVKHRMSGKSSFWRFTKNGEYVIELVGDRTTKIKNPKDIISYKNGFAVLAENGVHVISKNGEYLQQLVRETIVAKKFFLADEHFYAVNESSLGASLHRLSSGTNENMGKVLPEKVLRTTYSEVENVEKIGIHFYSVLNDTVFAFTNEQKSPLYEFRSSSLPTFSQLCDSIGERDDNETLRYLRENEHVIVRNYHENQRYIFLTYWVGSNSTTAIYNKKYGSVRYFGHGINDIDGGVWDKVTYLSEKDELFIPITAYKVSGHKISNKKERRFARLQNKIEASGNPVIMQVKLR
ncbi:6-bladed beta-propeller [Maribellus mangrovi]|uniref:6-bladed beta-propeller n=1 Tax=Maribellus mangrovi TaxID=3133146 RepID=UPI0030EB9CE8